ncbi:MAG: hypothetical protein S4CHLAM81_13120 [Chlamydiales bacterium]|nr:hypothetical protein [Chlamydiales bacterium]MCH9636084.1 hypothetical protein [Chlamydiales bacterium]MCH9704371.1 hypothetical protein [Chlamydiota bacterium]
MSTVDALRCYDHSVWGTRQHRAEWRSADPGYGSPIICHSCGGADSGEGCLALAAAIALFSTVIFTVLSAKAFNSAAKYHEKRKECIKSEVNQVYGALQRERVFTGFAHLGGAAASALLVAACVFGIKRMGPYMQLTIAGGVAAGGGLIFFMLRYSGNPRAAIGYLRAQHHPTHRMPAGPPMAPPLNPDAPPAYDEVDRWA